jgi:hypothetical protein
VSSTWARRAPCRGKLGLFAPKETAWASASGLARMCRPHLYTCGSCPFRSQCIALVMPAQAKFDGIAGGRTWCNGEVIDALPDVSDDELPEPKLRASCGTEAGARDHSRHGERACSSCRQVAREIAARRKEARDTEPEQLALDLTAA